MLAGVAVGVFVFLGMVLASVVLLSTMLASTDAAWGQKVMSDPTVPSRVRQPLDVEGGHNDCLAVLFFLVALEIANAELGSARKRDVHRRRFGANPSKFRSPGGVAFGNPLRSTV